MNRVWQTMKWPCMHIRTWDGRCLCKEKGLYQPSTYYLFVLARALLICIQPGFSLSLGDQTAVFSGITEGVEDGKNATLCSVRALTALTYAYHVFFTPDWKTILSLATMQGYGCNLTFTNP